MARGHLVFALSDLLSFRPFVPLKFVFSTPPTSLHGFEWNLAGVLHHKSRSAFGEIIYVQQSLAELWSLTLRILTHFSLSSQLLRHPCMNLMKLGRDVAPQVRIWCGEIIHVQQILAKLWSLTLRIFTHLSLSFQLLLHSCMDFNETWQGCCTTSLDVHVGR